MISIVMPLYNAECFLRETLDSILAQTYCDYELFCINDASEDATVEIVQEYMQRDARIKLIHNTNRRGAAEARNIGLRETKGEYICFLDGDDIFDENMLYEAYKIANEYTVDIIVFEYLHVDTSDIYKRKLISKGEEYKNKYCKGSFSVHDMSLEDYASWSNSPCNKLFRKEFITENSLEFQSLSCSNDVYFIEMTFLLAKKIIFLESNHVMIYARDHFTPTRISFKRDPMCAYQACLKIFTELKKRGEFDSIAPYICFKSYFILLTALIKAKPEEEQKEFYKFLQEEGIKKLKSIGDTDLPLIFNNFLEKSYYSKWFLEESLLYYFIKNRQDILLSLVNKYPNIVVWGTGNYGRGIIKWIDSVGIEVRVVDKNPQKYGSVIGSFTIQDFKTIDFTDIDMVIVSAKGAFEYVQSYLKEYDIKVIDLLEIVGVLGI